jgi:hypothetical protein
MGKEMIIHGVSGSKEEGSGNFLHAVLQNEGRCWTDFYKYVKPRKGNRENIPGIKDHNGKSITHQLEKASLFGCESNSLEIPQNKIR